MRVSVKPTIVFNVIYVAFGGATAVALKPPIAGLVVALSGSAIWGSDIGTLGLDVLHDESGAVKQFVERDDLRAMSMTTVELE